MAPIDIYDWFPNGLSVEDVRELLEPVAFYVIGIALYAVFIFNFYRFVSARDMFAFDVYRYDGSRYRFFRSFFHVIGYVLKYLIVFPLFAFFWFAVLTIMLSFLSEGREVSEVLLISLATVSAIRFSAYYNEDLSRDLAKILPFALLALFLIDASFFDIGNSWDTIRSANDHRETILYYLLFLIGLELVLRFGFGFGVWLVTKRPVNPRRQTPSTEVPPTEESGSTGNDQVVVNDGEIEDVQSGESADSKPSDTADSTPDKVIAG